MKTAYFAGGCFWCITPMFRELEGVESVTSGYSGGDEAAPAYADVKAQKTGHRETIAIDYEPEKVAYTSLLDIFLANVDPFDAGGQFIDRGHSYTLAVYYADECEKAAALSACAELEKAAGKAPCVAIEPFKSFWPAEEYHQDYYLKHPAEFERELIESGRKK